MQAQFIAKNILWSDKSLFTNSGMFNRRNTHYYALENPHLTRQVRPQVRFSVNVWRGLLGNKVLGLNIYNGRLISQSYLSFLENEFEGCLDDLPIEAGQTIRFF